MQRTEPFRTGAKNEKPVKQESVGEPSRTHCRGHTDLKLIAILLPQASCVLGLLVRQSQLAFVLSSPPSISPTSVSSPSSVSSHSASASSPSSVFSYSASFSSHSFSPSILEVSRGSALSHQAEGLQEEERAESLHDDLSLHSSSFSTGNEIQSLSNASLAYKVGVFFFILKPEESGFWKQQSIQGILDMVFEGKSNFVSEWI